MLDCIRTYVPNPLTAPLAGKDLRAFVRPQAELYREIVTAGKISLE